jgi:hypothetical protein
MSIIKSKEQLPTIEIERWWLIFKGVTVIAFMIAFWLETAIITDPLSRFLQTALNLLPTLLLVALLVYGLSFFLLAATGEYAKMVAVGALLLGVGFFIEGVLLLTIGRSLTLHDFIHMSMMVPAILIGAGLRILLFQDRGAR